VCFSVESDLAVGLLLLPVGVASLREVRHVREVPFAALPLLFAVHQLIEAVVWASAEGSLSASVGHAAAIAYLVIALPLLPLLFPLAVLLLEPRGARARVAPFVALGGLVSAYLAVAVVTPPVAVMAHEHALVYYTGVPHEGVWTTLYIVAVIGPSLLSGYPTIVAFGVLNLVGLAVVAMLYQEAFLSLWCVWAACTSLLVLLHMRWRRRLPDPHRLEGVPLAGKPS